MHMFLLTVTATLHLLGTIGINRSTHHRLGHFPSRPWMVPAFPLGSLFSGTCASEPEDTETVTTCEIHVEYTHILSPRRATPSRGVEQERAQAQSAHVPSIGYLSRASAAHPGPAKPKYRVRR